MTRRLPPFAFAVFVLGIHYFPLAFGYAFTNYDPLKTNPLTNATMTSRTVVNGQATDVTFIAFPYYRQILTNFRSFGGFMFTPNGHGGSSEARTDPAMNASALPGAAIPPTLWLSFRAVMLTAVGLYGMFLLAGIFTPHRFLRIGAGLVYLFSGPFQAYLFHHYRIAQYIAPFTLYFLFRLLRRPQYTHAIGYVATLFLCLRNNEEFTFYFLIVTSFVCAVELALRMANKDTRRDLAGPAAVLALTLVALAPMVFDLMAAVTQVKGSLRGMRSSGPGGETDWYFKALSYLPFIVGNSFFESVPGQYTGPSNSVEFARFCNALAMVLIPFGAIVSVARIRHTRARVYLATLAGIALCVALMNEDRFVRTLLHHTPFLGSFTGLSNSVRAKEVYSILACTAFAASVHHVDLYLRRRPTRRRALAFTFTSLVAIAIAVLCVSHDRVNREARGVAASALFVSAGALVFVAYPRVFRVRRRFALALLVAAGVAHSFWSMRPYHTLESPDAAPRETKLIAMMRMKLNETQSRGLYIGPPVGNALEAYGLRTIHTYRYLELDEPYLAMFAAMKGVYVHPTFGIVVGVAVQPSAVLNLLNIRYIASVDSRLADDSGMTRIASEAGVTLLENTRARGLVYSPRGEVTVANSAEHLTGLLVRPDGPEQLSVFHSHQPAPQLPPTIEGAQITNVHSDWQQIDADVETNGTSVIVFATQWKPEWRVYAGEKPLDTFRAYGALLAVRVEASKAHLSARFEPDREWKKALGSAIFLTLLALALIPALKHRRVRAPFALLVYIALTAWIPLAAKSHIDIGSADLRDISSTP